jgi:hypothetical protein
MCGDGGGNKQEFMQSERFATIARNLYNDYERRYVPWEKQLSAVVQTEQPEVTRWVGEAKDTTNRAFDAQMQGLKRDYSRMGITPDAQGLAAAQRRMDIQREGVLTNLQNSARTGIRDRNMGLMAGGLTAQQRQIGKAMGQA